MADDLARASSRGVFVTLGGFVSRSLLQLGSVVVLSRLLTPEDFGLIAMIMAIVGVADLVRDFGLTGAILQRKNIAKPEWQGLAWLSTGFGLLLGILLAAGAPLVAALYNEPRLVPLTLALAPTLLLNGLSAPIQARIQRDLRFSTLASIEVMHMLVGVALAIGAALLGWGAWALVVQSGAGQIYRMVALCVASPPSFGRLRITRDVVDIVQVGRDLLGMQLLNYASRNVDNVLIGNQLGPATLGQYSRAYSLFLLPMQQLNATIGRVAVPILSRLQDDPERYRRYIRAGSRVIGYFTVPVYAVLAAVAAPLIRTLLGEKWDEAAVLFSILSIAGVAQAMGNMQGWIYLTLGRTRTQFVFFLITRPLIVAGFAVGLWLDGVRGLAWAYSLLSMVLLIPGYHYALRGSHVRWRDVFGPMLRPTVITPLCFATAWAAVQANPTQPALIQLILGSLAGFAPLAASLAVPAFRRDFLAVIEYAKKARERPPRPQAKDPLGGIDGEA